MVADFFHRFFRLVIVFLVGLVVGVWLSPRHKTISTYTTVDTTIYYRPMPTTTSVAEVRTISLPRLLFAPADTVHTTTVIVNGDSLQHSLQHSLQLQVPIEKREYRDSNYYAVVSGAVIGDIRPSLDYFELYNRTTVQTVKSKPKALRPYISGSFGKESAGAGAGLIIVDKFGLGINYIYAAERSHLMAECSIIF